MKKIFLFFAILIAAISLQAQNFNSVLNDNITYRYNDVSTVVSDTSTYEVVWEIRSHYPFTYSVGFDIDSVAGTSGKDTLYIDGRIDSEDSWTSLGSVIPTANSELMRLTNDTSAVRYRQLRALYTKTDTSNISVDYHWLKIWRE
jgi:ureidoglycolate hydrolase